MKKIEIPNTWNNVFWTTFIQTWLLCVSGVLPFLSRRNSMASAVSGVCCVSHRADIDGILSPCNKEKIPKTRLSLPATFTFAIATLTLDDVDEGHSRRWTRVFQYFIIMATLDTNRLNVQRATRCHIDRSIVQHSAQVTRIIPNACIRGSISLVEYQMRWIS